jgi:hypothetical protein
MFSVCFPYFPSSFQCFGLNSLRMIYLRRDLDHPPLQWFPGSLPTPRTLRTEQRATFPKWKGDLIGVVPIDSTLILLPNFRVATDGQHIPAFLSTTARTFYYIHLASCRGHHAVLRLEMRCRGAAEFVWTSTSNTGDFN